jgi:hypothetical protein
MYIYNILCAARSVKLVDQQWNWRENQALSRRLKNAKLRTPNCLAYGAGAETPPLWEGIWPGPAVKLVLRYRRK